MRESVAGYSPATSLETATVRSAERERAAANGASPWQLLVRVCDPGEDFDHVTRGRSRANGGIEASPHGRMERLLRHTGVAAGLLFNGTALRLISAPRGESSGWLDFRVADMLPTAGRPISTGMRLLLGQTRLLSVPRPKRLAALLEDSRKYQNESSERLAEQVLHALYELLRGFQAAHDTSKGELLREPLAENPDEVYRGLLTVVLRLVFLLYAEERDMLSQDETFLGAYSLAGLYERLREDAARCTDIRAGSRSGGARSRRSRRFTGRSSFRRCSTGRGPGFDSVVGNPPFAGKNTVAAANVAGYPDWLKQVHEESHGNVDLVAHFFRRAFGCCVRAAHQV